MVQGKYITLRMAKAEEQELIYKMGLSTDYMRECFTEDCPKGLDSFIEDYGERYFDYQQPEKGGGMLIYRNEQPVGIIFYDAFSYDDDYVKSGCFEVDIWMYGEANCGKGFGVDAIVTITDYLYKQYNTHTFFMYPDKINLRAIRAYEKAGFIEVADDNKQNKMTKIFTQKYFDNSKPDDLYMSDKSVLMVKEYNTTV